MSQFFEKINADRKDALQLRLQLGHLVSFISDPSLEAVLFIFLSFEVIGLLLPLKFLELEPGQTLEVRVKLIHVLNMNLKIYFVTDYDKSTRSQFFGSFTHLIRGSITV